MANAAAVISGRDYKCFVAPWATAVVMPADTVAWGTAWGGTYVEEGYTTGGLHVTMGTSRTNIAVDQEIDPVFRVATGRDVHVDTTLAEITAPHIADATGQAASQITTVAAISGTRGHTDLDFASTIVENYSSVGFDIRNPGDGEPFRFLVHKGLAVGSPTLNFTPTAPAGIAFSIAALPDTTTTPTRILKVRDVIPALP